MTDAPPLDETDLAEIAARSARNVMMHALRTAGLYPDLETYRAPRQPEIDWFRSHNIPVLALVRPEPVRVATGYRAGDGRFEDDEGGATWFVFPEERDCIFWLPRTGEFATWNGSAFALGEERIDTPWTFAFDNSLNLHVDPLAWLRAHRDGIVVIRWEPAFDGLRDAPRICVPAGLLATYTRQMQPQNLPEISVRIARREAGR